MAEVEELDFFISRNSADHAWAEWLAWVLDEAKYRVVVQDWDFQAGENFVYQMQQASSRSAHTVCVLSPDWLVAEYNHAEWYAAFANDALGLQRRVLPVRTTFNNLGLVLRDLGELPAARVHFERALRIGEAAYGPDHRNGAIIRAYLAAME